MKLHWSPRSPQVRKVMIVAHELGIVDRIARVRTVVDPLIPNTELMAENPLSKIPTLMLDDGAVLYDSPVICEYLDSLHDSPRLHPSRFEDRMGARRLQALGDGFVEFLLLLRNERARNHPVPSLLSAYAAKRQAVLAALDREAGGFASSPLWIGQIAVGSALCYLDFRFPEHDWRTAHVHLARWHDGFLQRASVLATDFVDD